MGGGKGRSLKVEVDWGKQAKKGFLASGIDPADRKGYKNNYIDLLQKMALEEVLKLKGDETVLDFGCGSGRVSYWIAPKVKKVVGLETTREMIDLAKNSQKAGIVELKLYDGVQFPIFQVSFDLILSIGVLQYMKGERLKRTVAELTRYLKPQGKICLLEQVSDNPRIDRPGTKEYLHAFEESKLKCRLYYPIREGRWWLLYMIRYGLIPQRCFPQIAAYEIRKRKNPKGSIQYYEDFLFLLEK